MKELIKKTFVLFVILYCFKITKGQLVIPKYFEENEDLVIVEEINANEVAILIEAEKGYLGAIARGNYSVWYGCGDEKKDNPFIFFEEIHFNLLKIIF